MCRKLERLIGCVAYSSRDCTASHRGRDIWIFSSRQSCEVNKVVSVRGSTCQQVLGTHAHLWNICLLDHKFLIIFHVLNHLGLSLCRLLWAFARCSLFSSTSTLRSCWRVSGRVGQTGGTLLSASTVCQLFHLLHKVVRGVLMMLLSQEVLTLATTMTLIGSRTVVIAHLRNWDEAFWLRYNFVDLRRGRIRIDSLGEYFSLHDSLKLMSTGKNFHLFCLFCVSLTFLRCFKLVLKFYWFINLLIGDIAVILINKISCHFWYVNLNFWNALDFLIC